MKVLILGGGGAMAKGIFWDLINNNSVEKVVLADLDIQKADTLAASASSPKVSTTLLDATDHVAMVSAFKEVDAVANSAWYELNVPIMQACLQAGTHYADLGGLYHVTLEQLKLDEEFNRAGLAAILGIGASPGLTNLCIGKAVESLDEIHEVHIRTGAKGGAKGFAYSAKTIIDEVTMRPAVYQKKKLDFIDPLTGREKYVLPEPVGKVEGFYSIHSELATIPYLSDSINTVTFRVAFSPSLVAIVDSLMALRLLSDDSVDINGQPVTAKEFLFKFLSRLPEPEYADEYKSFRVEVIGLKEGKETTCTYETLVESVPSRSLRATSIWTGVPLAIALDLVTKGVITKKGVFAPESGIPAGPFFNELAKRSIVIIEKIS